MSDVTALAAFLVSVAVVGAIWLWGRRADARSRERFEAIRAAPKREVRPVDPADIPAALKRVLGDLDTAKRLLDEVYVIGLWSKSDDSSDNRRKRQGMRETDWAISGAHRALTDLRSHLPDVPPAIHALEQDLGSLVAVIEPLPETVSDTMLETPALDVAIRKITDEITKLSERASQLAAEYG